jgi:type IV secretory pathway VirD2 relaxase
LGLRFTETKLKLRNDEYFIFDAYRAVHNSRPKEKEETGDHIWMCNFEEKESNLKDNPEKTT